MHRRNKRLHHHLPIAQWLQDHLRIAQWRQDHLRIAQAHQHRLQQSLLLVRALYGKEQLHLNQARYLDMKKTM
jgi:hypothetical protein